MNRTEMAKAYRELGMSYLQIAEVIEGGEVAPTAPPPSGGLQPLQPMQPPPAPAAAPPAQVDAGLCPIHKEPLRASNYAGKPAYCPKSGGDPAWTNPRGYCTINSDNVAQYLAIRSRAAATR